MNTEFKVKLTRFDIHVLNDAIQRDMTWIENKVNEETDELAIACMRERYRKLLDVKFKLNDAKK